MHQAEQPSQDLAGSVGSALDPLTEAFGRAPESLDFFFAVRWLSLHLARTARREGVSAAIGRGDRPGRERLRFSQRPDLVFMPSTITGLEYDEPTSACTGEEVWDMSVAFFGLFGPNGPLPWHVAEIAMARKERERDPCLLDFLNLFNHRAISLYYRGWAEHQLTIAADRDDLERFGRYIGSVAGLDDERMRSRGVVPGQAKLHYAGLLALSTRPGEGLAALLSDHFRTPVAVMPFSGRWILIPVESRCRLGGLGRQLGVDTVVGERVWEVRQCFTLRIGPLDLPTFTRLLPGGQSHEKLRELVRLYVGDELACDAVLVLARDEARPVRLGEQAQLGYSSWVRSTPFEEDLDQSTIPVLE
ncbi:MAG: type VI secretion system baseplate subunit TssG [Phycisphaerales bacterium]|nr:type VI secretion system baseplate subunit TssG [Phycisphaerales bacterium]